MPPAATRSGWQIEYARRHGIPWGMSEAAFAALDAHRTYQYQAFGVPGLGLKRGLEDDLVVAPYASALALMVEPRAGRGEPEAARPAGRHRPATDTTTPSTTPAAAAPRSESGVIVYTYMVHHQGMILLALDNVLNGGSCQKRFHADPAGAGHRAPPLRAHPGIAPAGQRTRLAQRRLPGYRRRRRGGHDAASPRRIRPPHGLSCWATALLGDGDQRGRRLQPLARPRHLALASRYHAGLLGQLHLREGCGQRDRLVRDPSAGAGEPPRATWSISPQTRCNSSAGTRTSAPSPISWYPPRTTRRSGRSRWSTTRTRSRHLEVTSYVELALAPHNADQAHPAFSKLFVETEALEGWASPARQAQATLAEGPGDLGGARPGRHPRESKSSQSRSTRPIGPASSGEAATWGTPPRSRPGFPAAPGRSSTPSSACATELTVPPGSGCGSPSSRGRPRPRDGAARHGREVPGSCGPPTGLSRWRNPRHRWWPGISG